MAPKKKGKGGEKASRPVTPPAASVPTSAPPSSAPASAPSSHISPDNTAPISSSSSLQTVCPPPFIALNTHCTPIVRFVSTPQDKALYKYLYLFFHKHIARANGVCAGYRSNGAGI
jgi:hypothetical protein